MSKKYCIHCNFANEVGENPLKFCGNCGKSFAGANLDIRPEITIGHKSKKNKQKEQYDEEEGEDSVNDNKLEFDSPSFEINLPKRTAEKFETFAFDKGPKQKILRPKMKKTDMKHFKQEWINELKKGERNQSTDIGI